jgi:citrate lyase subunit beta/citryl-CoA lyase
MQAFRAHVAAAPVSRSFLFVPADDERKQDKALSSGADALILDLEDSVTTNKLPLARRLEAAFLRASAGAEVWVRINPWDSALARDDLLAVLPGSPTGIVVPKPRRVADVQAVAACLDELETAAGTTAGRTTIMPIATERPGAMFDLGSYADATERLGGLTWGAEDLGAALGASRQRDAAGQWLPPYQLARSLCLFAAAAAAVPAIDTVYTDYRDLDGLAAFAAAARRDGFEGMLAIHPAQVPVINAAFVPTAAEIDRAQRIVDLFAANPDAGVLGMDGVMLDRPHCLQARRILETASRFK